MQMIYSRYEKQSYGHSSGKAYDLYSKRDSKEF